MPFRVVSAISDVETIAAGTSVRERRRLRRAYGGRRWRKCKGVATVELGGGHVRRAELHWYECNGVGKKEMKIKRLF